MNYGSSTVKLGFVLCANYRYRLIARLFRLSSRPKPLTKNSPDTLRAASYPCRVIIFPSVPAVPFTQKPTASGCHEWTSFGVRKATLSFSLLSPLAQFCFAQRSPISGGSGLEGFPLRLRRVWEVGRTRRTMTWRGFWLRRPSSLQACSSSLDLSHPYPPCGWEPAVWISFVLVITECKKGRFVWLSISRVFWTSSQVYARCISETFSGCVFNVFILMGMVPTGGGNPNRVEGRCVTITPSGLPPAIDGMKEDRQTAALKTSKTWWWWGFFSDER